MDSRSSGPASRLVCLVVPEVGRHAIRPRAGSALEQRAHFPLALPEEITATVLQLGHEVGAFVRELKCAFVV